MFLLELLKFSFVYLISPVLSHYGQSPLRRTLGVEKGLMFITINLYFFKLKKPKDIYLILIIPLQYQNKRFFQLLLDESHIIAQL